MVDDFNKHDFIVLHLVKNQVQVTLSNFVVKIISKEFSILAHFK